MERISICATLDDNACPYDEVKALGTPEYCGLLDYSLSPDQERLDEEFCQSCDQFVARKPSRSN